MLTAEVYIKWKDEYVPVGNGQKNLPSFFVNLDSAEKCQWKKRREDEKTYALDGPSLYFASPNCGCEILNGPIIAS